MVNKQGDPVFDADFFDFEEAQSPLLGSKLGKAKKKSTHVWDRDPHDWYVEPMDATAALLRVERFVGPIWDPCCGGGHIPRACEAEGLRVGGTDIVDRLAGPDKPSWWRGTFDFRQARAGGEGEAPNLPFPEWHATNIVMNPPYFSARGTEEFVRSALRIARGKVCAFASLSFLGGDDRAAGLYSEMTPHRIWIITPRPSCPPGSYLLDGGKASGDSKDYCWLVWDVTAPPVPFSQTGWARRRAA